MRQGLQAVGLLWASGWMVGCALTTQPDRVGEDAARTEDAVVLPDAALPEDADTPTEDAVVTPDAAVDPGSAEAIVGRWRAVRIRTAERGRVLEYRDNPIAANGNPSSAWVNGMLEVHVDRLLINVTSLGMQRVHSSSTEPYWRDQMLRTEGRLLPRNGGFVFEGTTYPGLPPLPFHFDPEGMLWLEVRDINRSYLSCQVGFVRDPTPARRASLEMSSEVDWRSDGPAPPADLQPVLFWDAPGAGFLVQRLATGPWAGTATSSRRPFALSFPGPPPTMYQGRVGGIAVAVAPIAFATDSHSDTQRIPTDQVPLPALRYAVVWRGEGPDEALRDTPFEGLVPGYSLALVPLMWNQSIWQFWLAPFDNTHLAPIDLRLRVPGEYSPPPPSEYSVPELLP